jgi:hypothetical protein
MVSMNRLDTIKRSQIVRCLVEGCSIRATVRMTGASKNTIAKLLVELGAVCTKYMDENLRDLPCQRIQVDEIWQFVGAKAKNVKPHHFEDGGFAGDVWTWTAIDADTMWYNFGRNHQTLKMTPAMKAGTSDHAWSVDEVIGLLEAVEPKATRPAKKSVSN